MSEGGHSGECVADGRITVKLVEKLDHGLLVNLVRYGREALGESALDEWMLPVVAGCGRLFVAEATEAGAVGAEAAGSVEGAEAAGSVEGAEVVVCAEDAECSRGGVIAGAAEVLRCMDAGDAYLEGLYIRPRFHGRGYGTALLADVMRILAGEGMTRLLVTVAPDNEPAMRLYHSAGFSQLDFLPEHYGPGRDRMLLAARLGGS